MEDLFWEFLGWLVADGPVHFLGVRIFGVSWVVSCWCIGSIKYIIFDETTQLASPPTSPRTSCVSGGVELAHLGGGVGGNGGFSGLPG